jgi:hypothetical protein
MVEKVGPKKGSMRRIPAAGGPCTQRCSPSALPNLRIRQFAKRERRHQGIVHTFTYIEIGVRLSLTFPTSCRRIRLLDALPVAPSCPARPPPIPLSPPPNL